MKRLAVVLAGCTLGVWYPFASGVRIPGCNGCQVINHPVVKVMDGTERIKIRDLLLLEGGIRNLLRGMRGHGEITYIKDEYTINQLVTLEDEGKLSDEDAFKETLNQAITKFEAISDDYLKQARGFKEVMLDLLRTWAEQRDRKDSLLLDWGKQSSGHEQEQFRQLVNSFRGFSLFLNDLKMFVRDLRFSCPKAVKDFKNELEEGKETEDKSNADDNAITETETLKEDTVDKKDEL